MCVIVAHNFGKDKYDQAALDVFIKYKMCDTSCLPVVLKIHYEYVSSCA